MVAAWGLREHQRAFSGLPNPPQRPFGALFRAERRIEGLALASGWAAHRALGLVRYGGTAEVFAVDDEVAFEEDAPEDEDGYWESPEIVEGWEGRVSTRFSSARLARCSLPGPARFTDAAFGATAPVDAVLATDRGAAWRWVGGDTVVKVADDLADQDTAAGFTACFGAHPMTMLIGSRLVDLRAGMGSATTPLPFHPLAVARSPHASNPFLVACSPPDSYAVHLLNRYACYHPRRLPGDRPPGEVQIHDLRFKSALGVDRWILGEGYSPRSLVYTQDDALWASTFEDGRTYVCSPGRPPLALGYAQTASLARDPCFGLAMTGHAAAALDLSPVCVSLSATATGTVIAARLVPAGGGGGAERNSKGGFMRPTAHADLPRPVVMIAHPDNAKQVVGNCLRLTPALSDELNILDIHKTKKLFGRMCDSVALRSAPGLVPKLTLTLTRSAPMTFREVVERSGHLALIQLLRSGKVEVRDVLGEPVPPIKSLADTLGNPATQTITSLGFDTLTVAALADPVTVTGSMASTYQKNRVIFPKKNNVVPLIRRDLVAASANPSFRGQWSRSLYNRPKKQEEEEVPAE